MRTINVNYAEYLYLYFYLKSGVLGDKKLALFYGVLFSLPIYYLLYNP